MHKAVAVALFLCLASCRREPPPDDAPYSPPRDPAQDYVPAVAAKPNRCDKSCCPFAPIDDNGRALAANDPALEGCDLANVWACSSAFRVTMNDVPTIPAPPARFSKCRALNTNNGMHLAVMCCPF